MVEWHLTPEYIIANWTDEKFSLLIEKLASRKKGYKKDNPQVAQVDQSVSAEALAATSRGMIKVVTKNDT